MLIFFLVTASIKEYGWTLPSSSKLSSENHSKPTLINSNLNTNKFSCKERSRVQPPTLTSRVSNTCNVRQDFQIEKEVAKIIIFMATTSLFFHASVDFGGLNFMLSQAIRFSQPNCTTVVDSLIWKPKLLCQLASLLFFTTDFFHHLLLSIHLTSYSCDT